MMSAAATRFTERLRLEPIHPPFADDLYRLHQDPGIAAWYDGAWTHQQAREKAAAMGDAWRADGVHKWLAYDGHTGTAIGRGGLSYADDVDGQRRLEIGWAVRQRYWGHGYATEIGAAGIHLAFNEFDAQELVAFTETYNHRSRAVMERLGFTYTRDIRHRAEPFVLYTPCSPAL